MKIDTKTYQIYYSAENALKRVISTAKEQLKVILDEIVRDHCNFSVGDKVKFTWGNGDEFRGRITEFAIWPEKPKEPALYARVTDGEKSYDVTVDRLKPVNQ